LRVCSSGVNKLRFFELGAKTNPNFFIQEFLEPLFAEDISRLYTEKKHEFFLHKDSTPGYALKKTQKWLENT
jgi:hypothetical protein